jgi:hypothetical protein
MDDIPKTILEALASPDTDDWKEAVHSEMDSIFSNETRELVYRPYGYKPMDCMWVFKNKLTLQEISVYSSGPTNIIQIMFVGTQN